MLPIPHIILFLPICVFASIAVAAAGMQILARFAPALRVNAPRMNVARPSAQIFYFTPRKTPLRSYAKDGLQRLAAPHR